MELHQQQCLHAETRHPAEAIVDTSDRQPWSSGAPTEDAEPQHVKEEREELRIDQLRRPEDGGIGGALISVKSEEDGELQQTPSRESGEAEPGSGIAVCYIKTEVDAESYGASAFGLDGDTLLRLRTESPEPETDDSEDWKESSEPVESDKDLRDCPKMPPTTEDIHLNVKEEREELRISPDKTELRGLKGVDATRCPFTAVCVKTENHEEVLDIKTESDGCRRQTSEPASVLDADAPLLQDAADKTSDATVSDSDDSFVWFKPSNTKSGLDSQKNMDFPVNDKGSKREQSTTCIECGKTFSCKSSLNRHKKMHSGENLFSCSVCNTGFTDRHTLARHTRTHTGEKPFICSICVKRFSEKGDMTRHMRIHTGVKPFSCSACGKRFSHKGTMTRHMSTHTGAKPFSCAFCGKRFSIKVNMTTHVRIHTGEKPFGCSVCEKRFIRKFQLKSHKCAGRNTVKKV